MADQIDWKEESKRFDEAAAYYDKYRPGYPNELVDCIIRNSCIQPGARILEIGAGSGKATELFVNRGYSMHCVEPGENLALAGMQKFGGTGRVSYAISRLEDWKEPPGYFDLAISAQAFHWVPKPLGFQKCAQALKQGCSLGLFWNTYLSNSKPVDSELAELSARYGGLFPLSTPQENEDWVKRNVEEIRSSGCFEEPAVYRFPWTGRYNAEQYIGFIRTGNGYLRLSSEERLSVDEEVCGIINKHGGFLDRPYVCILFLARKIQ